METFGRPIDILLVEDNPADARLVLEGFRNRQITNAVHHVEDGVEAMAFLRREGEYVGKPKPDLVLLDLNLPRMDGREVLAAMKKDEELHRIPVVVLTTSTAEDDVLMSYDLHANSFISKPVDFSQFCKIIESIESFWLSIITLPPR